MGRGKGRGKGRGRGRGKDAPRNETHHGVVGCVVDSRHSNERPSRQQCADGLS